MTATLGNKRPLKKLLGVGLLLLGLGGYVTSQYGSNPPTAWKDDWEGSLGKFVGAETRRDHSKYIACLYLDNNPAKQGYFKDLESAKSEVDFQWRKIPVSESPLPYNYYYKNMLLGQVFSLEVVPSCPYPKVLNHPLMLHQREAN